MNCDRCGSDTHRDDAMNRRCNSCEHLVRQCDCQKESKIESELSSLLNRYSAESISGTPDFILANYLMNCLRNFNDAVGQRAEWRGESCELPALQQLRVKEH